MSILEFLSDAMLLQDDELNQRLLPPVYMRHLKKSELLIREEDMQTNVYFLMNGVLRGYFIDGEGVDRYGQQQAYCYVSGNDARNAQPSAPRAAGERAGCGQGK